MNFMKYPPSHLIHHIIFFLFFLIPYEDLSAQSPDNYGLEKDIMYWSAPDVTLTEYMKERCLLDIYFPEDTPGFATIVWFHGGGLKAGNKFIPDRLKNQGIAVVAVNYRFSPEVSCPEYIQDAAAAVAWVFNNIEIYGGDPDLIIVSGHSAGGYLTSMVGLDKSYLRDHGIDANRIASLVPFSGHTITHMTVREERGIADTQPVIDKYAPLYHVRDDAPPLVLITGDRELEMLGRYEENAYMMRMMKVAGHKETTLYELDGFNHGGMAEPAYPLLLNEVRRIVGKRK
jgi:acetyl esterase/lipase